MMGAKNMRAGLVAAVTGLVLAGVMPDIASAGVAYTVTDLGTLGGTSSTAYGLNASGQVVGNAYTADNQMHAFLYSGSKMTDLGTLGGNFSSAAAINASGQIVGSSILGDLTTDHAFLYSGGTMIDLGTLGGTSSFATAINASGQIVGAAATPTTSHSFLYSGGTMTDIGAFGAKGINDSGQITGQAYLPGSWNYHALIYSGSTITDLGALAGNNSSAAAINASGQVAGNSSTTSDMHAVIYSGSTITDIDSLGDTFAFAINASGQVVGKASGSNPSRAFVYSGSKMTDLNTLIDPLSGWTLTEARGINDLGQIAGSGIINGQSHAVLLTPVPEPTSLVTLILGSTFLLGRRRKLA